MPPPLIGEGIKRCFCLTSVCRVHRPKSRTERPRSAAGVIFGSALLQPARSVCVSSKRCFSFSRVSLKSRSLICCKPRFGSALMLLLVPTTHYGRTNKCNVFILVLVCGYACGHVSMIKRQPESQSLET